MRPPVVESKEASPQRPRWAAAEPERHTDKGTTRGRKLSVRDFFHGCGEIDLKEALASTRLVTEALRRSFRIRVVQESPSHVNCKIIRFARLYGFPVLFSNPTLDIVWESRVESRVIIYCLTCYDYYIVAFGAVIFGILSSTMEHSLWASLKMGLSGAAMVLFFFGGLVFLDTKYLARRIRKALLHLTV